MLTDKFGTVKQFVQMLQSLGFYAKHEKKNVAKNNKRPDPAFQFESAWADMRDSKIETLYDELEELDLHPDSTKWASTMGKKSPKWAEPHSCYDISKMTPAEKKKFNVNQIEPFMRPHVTKKKLCVRAIVMSLRDLICKGSIVRLGFIIDGFGRALTRGEVKRFLLDNCLDWSKYKHGSPVDDEKVADEYTSYLFHDMNNRLDVLERQFNRPILQARTIFDIAVADRYWDAIVTTNDRGIVSGPVPSPRQGRSVRFVRQIIEDNMRGTCPPQLQSNRTRGLYAPADASRDPKEVKRINMFLLDRSLTVFMQLSAHHSMHPMFNDRFFHTYGSLSLLCITQSRLCMFESVCVRSLHTA